MSADNGSYVVKTPALNSLGYEFRVGHAQAIENAEWPELTERNRYLQFAFGSSWTFTRQRRAVALAHVVEEEIADACNGWGTEYGVCVIDVDTPFPHALTSAQQFGEGDAVYVLKSRSAWREGFDYHVVYSTEDVSSAVRALKNGSLSDVGAAANLIAELFAYKRSLHFSTRGRARRAAQLIHDDIVSRGGRLEHGVVFEEIAQAL